MKNIAIFLFIFLYGNRGLSAQIKFLASYKISHLHKFEKSTVGGLSDLLKDEDGSYWVISDDRGKFGDGRIYNFKAQFSSKGNSINSFQMELQKVVYLQTPQSVAIDFEAVSFLPWGNFLVTSEGDLNHRPRVFPEILDIKKNGGYARNYVVPAQFIPEKSGLQKKGVENNRAFEGLSRSPDGRHWLVMTESPLLQDSESSYIRAIEYTMPEAWVIRPAKQIAYPIEKKSEKFNFMKRGVSGILWSKEKIFLSIERKISPSKEKGLGIDVEIFETDFSKAEDISKFDSLNGKVIIAAEKKKIISLADILPQNYKIQNFEGLAWGPDIPGIGRTLLLVSDDNFDKDLATEFLLLSYKE